MGECTHFVRASWGGALPSDRIGALLRWGLRPCEFRRGFVLKRVTRAESPSPPDRSSLFGTALHGILESMTSLKLAAFRWGAGWTTTAAAAMATNRRRSITGGRRPNSPLAGPCGLAPQSLTSRRVFLRANAAHNDCSARSRHKSGCSNKATSSRV